MNLENLGLVELNAQEVQEVDGGTYCFCDDTLHNLKELWRFVNSLVR